MSNEFTPEDELASLRYLVARLVNGLHGEPVTAKRGKATLRFYRGEHDADLVERARSHFDGRKNDRLLDRLEELEERERQLVEALRPFARAGNFYRFDDPEGLAYAKVNDVRRAAAVLDGKEQSDGKPVD